MWISGIVAFLLGIQIVLVLIDVMNKLNIIQIIPSLSLSSDQVDIDTRFSLIQISAVSIVSVLVYWLILKFMFNLPEFKLLSKKIKTLYYANLNLLNTAFTICTVFLGIIPLFVSLLKVYSELIDNISLNILIFSVGFFIPYINVLFEMIRQELSNVDPIISNDIDDDSSKELKEKSDSKNDIYFWMAIFFLGCLCFLIFYMYKQSYDFKGVFKTAVDPGFLGALIGSALTGFTAIFILKRESFERRKDQAFRSYGVMQVMNGKLIPFTEIEKFSKEVILNKGNMQTAGFESLIKRSKKMNDEILNFLESEKEKVPFELVSRFVVLTTHFHHVSNSFERVIADPSEHNIQTLVKHMERTKKIVSVFITNNARYLKEVENKYNIKDFY